MKSRFACPQRPQPRENVFRSQQKPLEYDCLDTDREPSNARLPEVGTQRQIDIIII